MKEGVYGVFKLLNISYKLLWKRLQYIQTELVAAIPAKVDTALYWNTTVQDASCPKASYAPPTIGNTRAMIYIIRAAIPAVTQNVPTVTPMILPARLALLIFAMADDIEQNTIGTTTQNIKFVKIVPNGSRTVAPGHKRPTMQPAIIPVNMQIINP